MGPIIFGDKQHEVFLGRDFGHTKNYSEEIASKIDKHISEFIETAYKRTEELLSKNKELLKKISEDLIKKETLNREEFLAYFGKSKTTKKDNKQKKTTKKPKKME